MLTALATSDPAMAQPAADPEATLERVIVTGSQIPRADAETALPVQIIRREEIERSGVSNVQELMRRISANLNGATETTTDGSNTPGFSGASLRGFGSRSTLVLLNGRRVANYAFSDNDGIGVDLNVIPLAAVERVEVLKDGASAIYGSDAIAGVINFILRQDFRGAQIDVGRSHAQSGGGAREQETLSLGAGDATTDGFNVFAVIDHRREHALAAIARPYAATGYRPDLGLDKTSRSSFPANIAVNDGFVNPAAPGCTTLTVLDHGGCFFDYTKQTNLLPPTDNLSLLTRATWKLADGAQVHAELLWSAQRTRSTAAPTPVNRFGIAGSQQIVIPEGSPYYPTGLGLSGDIVEPLYRTVPLGPRLKDTKSEHQRALVGWQGHLAGWDVDAAALQSTSRATDDFASGYVDTFKLTEAFATGLVNPFGDSGPTGDALLASAETRGRGRESRGTTRSIDFRASRDIARWSAGPLTVGLGGEARTETLTDQTTPFNDVVVGNVNRATPKSGTRQAQALYVELAVPIVRTLDAQVALRADRHSDFGTSTSPKLALRWQPARSLLFRASAGTGFRAPSLPELYAAQGQQLIPVEPDPKRCPVTHLVADCEPEVLATSGGNPALQPERSRQASFGLVFEPASGASIGIDWWRLALQHTIGTLFSNVILNGDDRYEGKNIVRGPVDPTFPNLPGPITRLIVINENLGRQTASGVDLDLRYRTGPSPYGRFGVQLAGSYLADWRIALDGINEQSFVGGFDGAGSFPRWQHTLTLEWDRKPWTATLVQTLRGGYVDDNSSSLVVEPHRVTQYRVWDAQVAHSGIAGLTLVFGLKNLFNRDPPFSNQLAYGQVGYDPSYADPRGRVWYARASYRWR